MKLRRMGRTGLKVTEICLGTMTFGHQCDENTSFAIMDEFAEWGGTLIDTADSYSAWADGNPGGVAEEIIGRWLKARGNRDDLVIATKVRSPGGAKFSGSRVTSGGGSEAGLMVRRGRSRLAKPCPSRTSTS